MVTICGWVCSCPDHKFRDVKCKHMFAVEISFALRKQLEVARIEVIDTQCCIYCKSSWIVRNGLDITNTEIYRNSIVENVIDISHATLDLEMKRYHLASIS
ncbi:MAG: hypothetical protein WCC17_14650 [Candidatus Nitrosopolaris sp.]